MKADRLTALQALCDGVDPDDFDPRDFDVGLATDLHAGLVECLAHILELQDEIKCDDILLKGRKELLDELPECPMHGSDCVPYAVTAIKELYQTTSGQQDEIKSLKGALEATGKAMDVLAIKEKDCEIARLRAAIQDAVGKFATNPTGPAAHMMNRLLNQALEGGA